MVIKATANKLFANKEIVTWFFSFRIEQDSSKKSNFAIQDSGTVFSSIAKLICLDLMPRNFMMIVSKGSR